MTANLTNVGDVLHALSTASSTAWANGVQLSEELSGRRFGNLSAWYELTRTTDGREGHFLVSQNEPTTGIILDISAASGRLARSTAAWKQVDQGTF